MERKDFLEYSRKLKPDKHCYERLFVFNKKENNRCYSNTNFYNLNKVEVDKYLTKVKSVIISQDLSEEEIIQNNEIALKKLLNTALKHNLKNNEINQTIIEGILSVFNIKSDCNVYIYFGNYEIPQKRVYTKGNYVRDDDLNIYKHIVCVVEENNKTKGFMYPAYVDRSAVLERIDIIR